MTHPPIVMYTQTHFPDDMLRLIFAASKARNHSLLRSPTQLHDFNAYNTAYMPTVLCGYSLLHCEHDSMVQSCLCQHDK